MCGARTETAGAGPRGTSAVRGHSMKVVPESVQPREDTQTPLRDRAGHGAPPRCAGCSAGEPQLRRKAPWPSTALWRCPSCQSEFLDPQPSDARLAEIYGPQYYRPWHEETAAVVRRMKQLTFSPLLDATNATAGAAVLDVGCATGDLIAEVVRRGWQGYGVDLNEWAISEADRTVPEGTFFCGTLHDDPFPGVRFDAIVMVDFIEHVRDPRAELAAALARLHPGGRLVLSTPAAGSLTHRVTRRNWPQYREEHLTYLSPVGVTRLLQSLGATVESIVPTTKVLTPAYLYGQSQAYPLPVLSRLLKAAWPALPIPKHRPLKLRMGEMTVVARSA